MWKSWADFVVYRFSNSIKKIDWCRVHWWHFLIFCFLNRAKIIIEEVFLIKIIIIKYDKSTLKEAFTPLQTVQFLATPHRVTPPLPRHLLKFWPSGAWDQGKPRWRLIMAPLSTLFIFKSNAQGFCENAAWSFSSLVYQLLDHLTVIKKYFIENKKGSRLCTNPCDKALIMHCMENFDQSTGKM